MGDKSQKTNIDKEMDSKTPWYLCEISIPGDCEKVVLDKLYEMTKEISGKTFQVIVEKDNLTTDPNVFRETLKKIRREIPEVEIEFN